MVENPNARLISFDEAGFTGPRLLDEQQPYFVYASHDLTVAESEKLIADFRSNHRLQGNELKSKKLKKRGSWPDITAELCAATRGRAKVIVHNKKAALAGKFVEYFFDPVLAENNVLFYGANFHRYLMTTIYVLMKNGTSDSELLAEQMEAFMRSFDPAAAPYIFSNTAEVPVELGRILQFTNGYAATIAEETKLLRADHEGRGKWTLDLTSTALFSLLFMSWGHKYDQIRLLCDDSKPLKDGCEVFNSFVGRRQAETITDGRSDHTIRGNLVGPVEFGSSETHPTIQIADLLAGMSLDAALNGDAPSHAKGWLSRHQFHEHSIDFMPELANSSNSRVRVGREILKELARRARTASDPLDGMEEFIERTEMRFRK